MCIFHKWEFENLYYKQVSKYGYMYGVQLIEEYCCNKCLKRKNEIVENFNTNYTESYLSKMRLIERMGAKNYYMKQIKE